MNFFFIPDKTVITISILCAIGIYFMITYVINVHIPEHTRSLSGSLLGYKTIP